MTRRAAEATIHHPAINPVSDSEFDPTSKSDRPPIPKGLARTVRSQVASILDQNPYLTVVQVPAVIRLVKLRARFDELGKAIDEMGLVSFDAKKEMDIPNPLIALQISTQSSIITQERNLAISIPTRHEQIDKADRKPRVQKGKKSHGAPTLRIA